MRQVVTKRGPIPSIALAGFTAHLAKPIDFTKPEAMIRQDAD